MNDRTVTDEELIRRFQSGEDGAFDLIVARYRGPLFNFIYRILGDPAFSEDILQETFIRVWTNRSSYREIAKFSTWIYTIAGNLTKSELRRQKIRRWVFLGGGKSGNSREDEKPLDIVDDNADPERDLERRTIQRRVDAEIAKLPLVFREVIVLRDVQELSYEEIGSILQIPLGTVKSRVNRGRARLQERLKDLL
ncbi:MAG: sigma-70 family RNA polymerase sigma factor [Calditrichaeota bacterium]|nr:sigma-70 family RNA polymerase sigma factor [Calditrichota bacterium]